jgi:uncharacterized protein GlcG (DUF336 family)
VRYNVSTYEEEVKGINAGTISEQGVGMSISSEIAYSIMDACKQRARELRSPVSIAIVDAGGHLVLFERMMAPYGFATGDMAIAKASTAVMFNQSTDAIAQWGASIPGFAASLATMTAGKFIMAAGGWPLRINHVSIGGIGVSGGNAPGRDDEIAQAGLAVLNRMTPVPGPYPMPPASQQQPAQAPRIPTPGAAESEATETPYTQSLGRDPYPVNATQPKEANPNSTP